MAKGKNYLHINLTKKNITNPSYKISTSCYPSRSILTNETSSNIPSLRLRICRAADGGVRTSFFEWFFISWFFQPAKHKWSQCIRELKLEKTATTTINPIMARVIS